MCLLMLPASFSRNRRGNPKCSWVFVSACVLEHSSFLELVSASHWVCSLLLIQDLGTEQVTTATVAGRSSMPAVRRLPAPALLSGY